MARFETDNHFRVFAGNLELILANMPDENDRERLRRQRDQLRGLIAAEAEFRETLIKHPWGANVYRDFVKHIVAKNILAARPYFRERHEVFTRYISKALKAGNDKSLYRFRFNWTFVTWVMSSRKWPKGGKLAVLANDIVRRRKEILQENIPLALSQARIFWNSTPKSHLTYMDVVQLQCQGLLLAIDKFVPPKDGRMSDRDSLARFKVFRAVAIGIMSRDRVNAYSETLVHFYPKDRAKIYRANKELRRHVGDVNYEELAERVNVVLDDDKCVTDGVELQGLLAAGSTVSSDALVGTEDDRTLVETFADLDSPTPEEVVEHQDALDNMHDAIGDLDLRSRKLLRLKGVKNEREQNDRHDLVVRA